MNSRDFEEFLSERNAAEVVDFIRSKQASGHPQDLADLEALQS